MLTISSLALALLGAAPAPTAHLTTSGQLVAFDTVAPIAGGPSDSVVAAVASSSAEPSDIGRFNHKRAGLQIGAAMGVGAIWYQSQIELNKLDFDFDRTFSDQWRRLSTTSGYRFDDNNTTLNVGHAFMGSIYHQFARANGGSMAEALLFDFVTSSTWELTVEHREVVSINDTIVTSLGGVALGEGLFQMGEYFARSEPTVANRVLMSVLSPARAFAWLTGDRPVKAAVTDAESGLASDADHRFALSLGGAQPLLGMGAGNDAAFSVAGEGQTPGQASNAWQGHLRLDLELVNLREYGRAGRSRRNLRGGEFTSIEAQLVGGRAQMRNQSLSARASMWGHYRQNVTVVDPNRAKPGLTGSAWYLGSATAFDLSSDQLGTANDFVAAMHLIGPAVDGTVFRDRWTFRAVADVNPDFAMVRPFALRDLPTGVARAGMKSTLQSSDYYYAFGVHSAARVEAAYRKARAGMGVSYTLHDSIEGLDRHQNEYTSPTGIHHDALTRDQDLTDQRLKLRVYSEAPLPIRAVTVGVSLDYQRRNGTADELERTADDMRWGVHATYAM